MKRNISVIAASLLGVTLLTGCSIGTTSSQGFTITSQQLERVQNLPKVPSYTVQGNLIQISEIGTQSQGALPWERVLGTVEDVLAPVTVPIDGQDAPGVWVPVVIQVEQSDPVLSQRTIILRVYPYSEHAPDLTKLSKGQRVLAVGTGPYTDSTGISAVSLGWLISVADDGKVTDLYPEHRLDENFNDVADLFNMKPLS